jgi:ketosteroid isomerase-like protein
MSCPTGHEGLISKTEYAMKSNLDLIRSTYEGTADQKIHNLLALLSSEIEWTEAEGFPYGGTYRSADAILTQVFGRLSSEWIDYRSDIERYVADESTVVVFGWYVGTFKATQRSMRAAFAHRWTLHEGKVVRFFQYVDSTMVRSAMI